MCVCFFKRVCWLSAMLMMPQNIVASDWSACLDQKHLVHACTSTHTTRYGPYIWWAHANTLFSSNASASNVYVRTNGLFSMVSTYAHNNTVDMKLLISLGFVGVCCCCYCSCADPFSTQNKNTAFIIRSHPANGGYFFPLFSVSICVEDIGIFKRLIDRDAFVFPHSLSSIVLIGYFGLFICHLIDHEPFYAFSASSPIIDKWEEKKNIRSLAISRLPVCIFCGIQKKNWIGRLSKMIRYDI